MPDEHHIGEDLATNVKANITARMTDQEVRHPVEDIGRAPQEGSPPVPGAQWDEVHRRWERWDDAVDDWVVVGDAEGIPPAEENPLPSLLAREVLLADEAAGEDVHVPDVGREPAPAQGPKGAQWNEIDARWERWDDAAGGWVEAVADPDEGGSS